MKLELPDNNASVLFHMGNALQSIAKDLDVERVDKLASHVHKNIKKFGIFCGKRLTFVCGLAIIIHVVRAAAHGEKNMRMWRNWQTR